MQKLKLSKCLYRKQHLINKIPYTYYILHPAKYKLTGRYIKLSCSLGVLEPYYFFPWLFVCLGMYLTKMYCFFYKIIWCKTFLSVFKKTIELKDYIHAHCKTGSFGFQQSSTLYCIKCIFDQDSAEFFFLRKGRLLNFPAPLLLYSRASKWTRSIFGYDKWLEQCEKR